MNMSKRRRGYLSYLLRVWRTGSEGNAVWRASLENPFTRERQGFASLRDLFAFLQVQTDNADLRPFGSTQGRQAQDKASQKVERDDGDDRVKEGGDAVMS
jgi:hypothetical protein